MTNRKAEFLILIRKLENKILIFLKMLQLKVICMIPEINSLRKLSTLLSVKMKKLKRIFNRMK